MKEIVFKKKEKNHEVDEPIIIMVCQKCGSKSVDIKVWVDANTNEITGIASDGDSDDTWCNDCQDHTGLIIEDEYVESERNDFIQKEEDEE